jgi:hypothetical protein
MHDTRAPCRQLAAAAPATCSHEQCSCHVRSRAPLTCCHSSPAASKVMRRMFSGLHPRRWCRLLSANKSGHSCSRTSTVTAAAAAAASLTPGGQVTLAVHCVAVRVCGRRHHTQCMTRAPCTSQQQPATRNPLNNVAVYAARHPWLALRPYTFSLTRSIRSSQLPVNFIQEDGAGLEC